MEKDKACPICKKQVTKEDRINIVHRFYEWDKSYHSNHDGCYFQIMTSQYFH